MENIFYDGYYLLLSHVNVICYIKDNNILLYFTLPEQHQMTKKKHKKKGFGNICDEKSREKHISYIIQKSTGIKK